MAQPLDKVSFTIASSQAPPPVEKPPDITGLIVAGALIVGFLLMAKGK